MQIPLCAAAETTLGDWGLALARAKLARGIDDVVTVEIRLTEAKIVELLTWGEAEAARQKKLEEKLTAIAVDMAQKAAQNQAAADQKLLEEQHARFTRLLEAAQRRQGAALLESPTGQAGTLGEPVVIHLQLAMPPMPAPIINVTTPAQPAPVVNVEVAPRLTAELTMPATTRRVRVERDDAGRMSGATVSEY